MSKHLTTTHQLISLSFCVISISSNAINRSHLLACLVPLVFLVISIGLYRWARPSLSFINWNQLHNNQHQVQHQSKRTHLSWIMAKPVVVPARETHTATVSLCSNSLCFSSICSEISLGIAFITVYDLLPLVTLQTLIDSFVDVIEHLLISHNSRKFFAGN